MEHPKKSSHGSPVSMHGMQVHTPQTNSSIAKKLQEQRAAKVTILQPKQPLQAKTTVPAQSGRLHWPPVFKPESKLKPLQGKMVAPPVYKPLAARPSAHNQQRSAGQQGPPVYRISVPEPIRQLNALQPKSYISAPPGTGTGPSGFPNMVQRTLAFHQKLPVLSKVNSVVQRAEDSPFLLYKGSRESLPGYDPFGQDPDYISSSIASAKHQEATDRTVTVAVAITEYKSKVSDKGWTRGPASATTGSSSSSRRLLAVYTNTAGDSITVTTDIGSGGGSGKIYGSYTSKDGKLAGEGHADCTLERTKAQQTDIQVPSSLRQKGIATVIAYEGFLFAHEKGCISVTISGSTNFKSINLLKTALGTLRRSSTTATATASSASTDENTRLVPGGSESTGCSWCPRCFLTTACIRARNLPDDCEELTVLRAFRDSYLSENEERKTMVAEYYEIAPVIVKVIQSSPYSLSEFESIYDTIGVCVKLIRREQFQEALEAYRAMVQRLKGEYLVPQEKSIVVPTSRSKEDPYICNQTE